MILFEDRAATVLYKVLLTLNKDKYFLLPLNVCPIVPDTFLKANIKFKFIDIDIKTLCMDETSLIDTIRNDNNVGGVLFVHTYGIKINSEKIYSKIKAINNSIFIIDDQCPSIQNFNFDIENSHASLSLFSTGYSKFIDIGYGGYGFLKDKEFIKIFEDKRLTQEFIKYKELVNSKIPLMKKHKYKLNDIYRSEIPKKFHLGQEFDNWRFSILIKDKDILLNSIDNNSDLFASSHYPPIDHLYLSTTLKNSNAQIVFSKIVNLFNDFRFTEKQAQKCAKIVKQHIESF